MADPIRVAQIMGKMNGAGVEAVVMNYFRHICRSKIQFDFIVDRDSSLIPIDEIESLGGRVYLAPPYQKVVAYQQFLKALFKEQQWYIVHSHINVLSVFPLRAAKKAGVPVRIAHSHSTANPNERSRTVLKYILRTQSHRYPTDCFACGKHAGEWLFGKDAEFTVVPNAVNMKQFSFVPEKRLSLRREIGIDEDAFVVAHLGRFVSQKNQQFLLDAFAHLLKSKPSSVLLLAGSGPQLEEAISKVESLSISDSVHFLGQRNDADCIYCAADVLCMPSLYEGLPVAGIEAQASGLPLLISDNVSKEILITSKVEMLSLSVGAEEWGNRLASYVEASRSRTISDVDLKVLTEYDAQHQALKLMDKYLSFANRARASYGD